MATQTTIAEFTGADPVDGDGNPYIDITFPTAYASAAAWASVGGVNITSGGGVAAWIDETTRAGAGCRVVASGQFVGTVPVVTVDV